MAKKECSVFISTTNRFIHALSTKEKFRLRESDFTRNRKLPFEELVLCMLKLLRKSLVLELHSFFKDMNSSVKKITSSAFIQSRHKLNPDLFYELNHLIVNEYFTDNDESIKLFMGMRLLAIDGSTIELPFNNQTREHFGTYNNQHTTDDMVQGRVSILYDVLNNILLDGLLKPLSQGEIPLGKLHFPYAGKGDLLIMDRHYPGFDNLWHLQQGEIDFLIRCRVRFSNTVEQFYQSGKKEDIVTIRPRTSRSFKGLPYDKNSFIKVRMLRVELNTGEVEILMTSLMDQKKFPHKIFKELYFMRWGIETFYDRFKNIIGVEQFSGTSPQFIQQEFNCALYISNMQSILTQDAEQQVKEKYSGRKYEYKVNRSLALGFIRERLIKIYSDERETEVILKELKELFIEYVVPDRPGRKNKREIGKYLRRKKPKQFKNRRNLM